MPERLLLLHLDSTLSRIVRWEVALVGAAAVVTRDVAPYAIVAGNPARKIGDRPAHSLPHENIFTAIVPDPSVPGKVNALTSEKTSPVSPV